MAVAEIGAGATPSPIRLVAPKLPGGGGWERAGVRALLAKCGIDPMHIFVVVERIEKIRNFFFG